VDWLSVKWSFEQWRHAGDTNQSACTPVWRPCRCAHLLYRVRHHYRHDGRAVTSYVWVLLRAQRDRHAYRLHRNVVSIVTSRLVSISGQVVNVSLEFVSSRWDSGSWVMGHGLNGSNGSTNVNGSRGSRVSAVKHLTHDLVKCIRVRG